MTLFVSRGGDSGDETGEVIPGRQRLRGSHSGLGQCMSEEGKSDRTFRIGERVHVQWGAAIVEIGKDGDYYFRVVLRDDQIDLIAQRVVQLLAKLTTEPESGNP